MTTATAIPDGEILPGSEVGNLFGFTPERFDGWLWKKDGKIIISFIQSLQPEQGHFKALVKAIHDAGYPVVVPTPLGRMAHILAHWGFTHSRVWDDVYQDNVELWTKKP